VECDSGADGRDSALEHVGAGAVVVGAAVVVVVVVVAEGL
jgi:hypothetical protein